MVGVALAAILASGNAKAWMSSKSSECACRTGSSMLDNWSSPFSTPTGRWGGSTGFTGGSGVDFTDFGTLSTLTGSLKPTVVRGTIDVTSALRTSAQRAAYGGNYTYKAVVNKWSDLLVTYQKIGEQAVGGAIVGGLTGAYLTYDPRKIAGSAAIGAATSAWKEAWTNFVDHGGTNGGSGGETTGTNCPCSTP
jgi:hypothetical protein